MEKYYLVTVEETLSRTVKVKADNLDEAYRKVKDAYRECEIVLDADDFVDAEITARKVTDEELSYYEELEEDEEKDE